MTNFLEALNSEQLKPVMDTDGAVLVLAGAGSGKTRVLTSRIARLVKDLNVYPYNILAITFTNKAANEMKERLSQIIDCDGMWICTIHSMCTRILRADIDKIGFTRNFTIFSEVEKQRVMKKLVQDKSIDDDKIIKKVMWFISDAKNRAVDTDHFANYYQHDSQCDIMAEIYLDYETELKRQNALDFDDLLIKTQILLASYPEVRRKYAERFSYVHIDEFQDTNKIQFKVVQMLCSVHKNIFAVGDDDQSIYGWRGADISNILEFRNNFEGAKIYKLEQNYRSTKKILNAANRIIKHNITRMNKELWTENDEGVQIEYNCLKDEVDEAYYVVGQIKSMMQYSGYKNSDFAVLMRVNALSRAFETEFLKYNIPYKIYGGFKFFERKEVKDVLGYLRIVANPYDEDAILRVLNVPKRGIGQVAINNILDYAKFSGLSLYDAILDVDNSPLTNTVKNKFAGFKDLLENMVAELEIRSQSDFMRYLVHDTGIYGMYMEDDEESQSKRLNLDELISSAENFEKQNPESSIVDYLQSVTLESSIDSDEDSSDSVTLATVHSVKGLEFKVVFIVGLDDGIFPLIRAKQSLVEMEEERRLMYVAITRARERLHLTRANSRFLYGKRDFTINSQFINELDLMSERKKFEKYLNDSAYVPNKVMSEKPVKSNKDMTKCVIGGKVVHNKFGEGIIVSLSGEDSNIIIEVAFKGVGMKTLSVNFAPIEFV